MNGILQLIILIVILVIIGSQGNIKVETKDLNSIIVKPIRQMVIKFDSDLRKKIDAQEKIPKCPNNTKDILQKDLKYFHECLYINGILCKKRCGEKFEYLEIRKIFLMGGKLSIVCSNDIQKNINHMENNYTRITERASGEATVQCIDTSKKGYRVSPVRRNNIIIK